MTILEGYFAKIKDYPEDELKLCVASSYPFFVKSDKMIHYPSLAPSLRLLREYKASDITWEQYTDRFKDEMKRQGVSWQNLVQLKEISTEGNAIRLLCWEKAEDKRCHRFLLLDILSSMEEK